MNGFQSEALPGSGSWWESRAFVVAMIALAYVPLVYPAIPPLPDLLGHMGRYRVQLDGQTSALLQQYYAFEWTPIGNLGVDLFVEAMAPVFGLELAVKLIVINIPPLTVAGFLWVAREVHGKLPPTAAFALPFAFAHPFLFGFVNFALAMALAFLAFGLWLWLGRHGRFGLRALIFAPLSFVLFFCHAFGWGTLGLLAFSAETVRRRDAGSDWTKAALGAAVQAAIMAGPILVMLAWRSDLPGSTSGDFFNWPSKAYWTITALRDRWDQLDVFAVLVSLAILLAAAMLRAMLFSRMLMATALILFIMFLLLPRILFGSAFADMRLIPYVIALMLLAIRARSTFRSDAARVLAVAGASIAVIKLAAVTVSLAIASNEQQRMLGALDRVERGSAVATFVGEACGVSWPLSRHRHLGGLAIARREAFSNDQWDVPGASPLVIRYHEAGAFAADPSQQVVANGCPKPGDHREIDVALRSLSKTAFDYVWLIDTPAHDPNLLAGTEKVWDDGLSQLYRLDHAGRRSTQP